MPTEELSTPFSDKVSSIFTILLLSLKTPILATFGIQGHMNNKGYNIAFRIADIGGFGEIN